MATFFATDDLLVNDEYVQISSLPAHIDNELDDHVADNSGAKRLRAAAKTALVVAAT